MCEEKISEATAGERTMKKNGQILALIIASVLTICPLAFGGQALNGNAQFQDGELGNKAGVAVMGTYGGAAGKEYYDANTNPNYGQAYGPPASAAAPQEQYGPNQEPDPEPAPVPQGPAPD
jgi:hypothetical protein